jgi:hypothetical protein
MGTKIQDTQIYNRFKIQTEASPKIGAKNVKVYISGGPIKTTPPPKKKKHPPATKTPRRLMDI